jgi:hypothetical protein
MYITHIHDITVKSNSNSFIWELFNLTDVKDADKFYHEINLKSSYRYLCLPGLDKKCQFVWTHQLHSFYMTFLRRVSTCPSLDYNTLQNSNIVWRLHHIRLLQTADLQMQCSIYIYTHKNVSTVSVIDTNCTRTVVIYHQSFLYINLISLQACKQYKIS